MDPESWYVIGAVATAMSAVATAGFMALPAVVKSRREEKTRSEFISAVFRDTSPEERVALLKELPAGVITPPEGVPQAKEEVVEVPRRKAAMIEQVTAWARRRSRSKDAGSNGSGGASSG